MKNPAVWLLVVVLTLVLAQPAAAGDESGGGGGGRAGDGPSFVARRDYRAARSAAIGLTCVGVLLGIAGMAASADRPDAYLQARRLTTLCAVLFVLAVTDRIVIQSLFAWFRIPDSYLPAWWR